MVPTTVSQGKFTEYALISKNADEPAFKWWAHYTLRKRDRIISKVKARFEKKTHKFGIEVPTTVKQALEIDREAIACGKQLLPKR